MTDSETAKQIRASEIEALRPEIAAYLASLDRRPPSDPDEMVDHENGGEGWYRMDVRLQIVVTPHTHRPLFAPLADPSRKVLWSVHTGDSSYDQDHRGYWGSTSVTFLGDPDGDAMDAAEVADELIGEAMESAAQADELIDDGALYLDHAARLRAEGIDPATMDAAEVIAAYDGQEVSPS